MRGYAFALSCPYCGTPVEHVTGSTAAGTETTAVARCPRCRCEWFVSVHVRPMSVAARKGMR